MSHLCIFGSVCYRHVPDQLRRKLDDKGEQLILAGYHATRGYKLYNPVSKQIIISGDVIVDEMKNWDWSIDRKYKGIELILEDSVDEVHEKKQADKP